MQFFLISQEKKLIKNYAWLRFDYKFQVILSSVVIALISNLLSVSFKTSLLWSDVLLIGSAVSAISENFFKNI